MNGEEELDSEMLLQAQMLIDDFEKSLSYRKYNPSTSATKYLEASPTYINKMAPDECNEAAIILQQYAIFIQKTYNELEAKINITEQVIKNLVIKKIGDYAGYSYDERFTQAVADNDVAIKLNKIKNNMTIKRDSLSYMSGRIEKLSDKFEKAAYNKRRN